MISVGPISPTSYPNQACILPDELLWQIPSGKRGANRMAISPTWRGGTGGMALGSFCGTRGLNVIQLQFL